MPPFRTNKLTKCLALASWWLVLLVIGLGLSRHVIVCTQPCCGGHVKLAPSCDLTTGSAPESSIATTNCCDHDRHRGSPDERRPGDERTEGRPGCSGCVNVSLGVDLGLPPANMPTIAGLPAPSLTAVVASPWADIDAFAVVHPPATGPPRCDRRTELLASTILRL